jgi:DNA-binding MarR family transcriptional regulator
MENQALASELRTVVSRLVKKLRRKSATGDQLSLTERSTIFALDQYGELYPNELASMEKITMQSMSQILSHLLELGIIIRTPSQTDKRKTLISLSDFGKEVLLKVRTERDEWLDNALHQTCTPEDMDKLIQALGPLKKLVEFD